MRAGRQRAMGGAILLEVVLALALFVAAATVITLGVQSSVVAVDRLRFEAHGMNLASSTLAELQIQARPLEAVTDERPDPPWDDWQVSITLEPMETDVVVESLIRVEVTVVHEAERIVVRLGQVLRLPGDGPGFETEGLPD